MRHIPDVLDHPAGRTVVAVPAVLHVADTLADDDVHAWLSLLSGGPLAPAGSPVIDLGGALPMPDWARLPAARLTRLAVGGPAHPAGWLRLHRALVTAPEPIVHLHGPRAIALAAPLARRAGKAVVATLYQERIGPTPAEMLIDRLETHALNRLMDHVIAVGPATLASHAPRLGTTPATVLPPLIRGPQPRSSATRSTQRRALGIVDRDVLLLSVALLDDRSDPLTLLAAFVQLQAHRPDTALVMAGDGPLRARVEAALACLALEDRVRLIDRPADLADLMAAADVVVSSAARAGHPVVLAEAAARGLPIAATRVGDIPAIVRPGLGLLVEPGRPKALADALATLCTAPPCHPKPPPAPAPLAWHRTLAAVYTAAVRAR